MIFLSILHQNSDVAAKIRNYWASKIPAELAPSRRAARALLHEMLTRDMNLRPDSYRLAQDKAGRPALESDEDIRLPAVSLTHSDGWIACAAEIETTPAQPGAVGTIGLDLELAKARRNHLELARAAFGPREMAAVQRGGRAAFYRIWTLREAWSKAAGLGFAGVVDQRDRVPEGLLEADVTIPIIDTKGAWWSARPLPALHLAIVSLRSAASPLNDTENRSTPQFHRCHVSPDLDLSGFSFVNFDHRL